VTITPRIAVAMLILHLVYGFTLEWSLLERKQKQLAPALAAAREALGAELQPRS